MNSPTISYLGIHISSGKTPFVLAVYHGGHQLEYLGNLALEGVLERAAAVGDVYMAINAPFRLSQGLLAVPELLPPGLSLPSKAQQRRMRLVEYELKQAGLPVGGTPENLDQCPRWIKRGFTLYEQLGEMGYSPYPVPGSPRQWIEIRADAAYQRLLKCTPYRARTIEGRLQRQLLLHEIGLPVPDPMAFLEEISRYRLLNGILPLDDIHSPAALNALLSAYIASLVHKTPNKVVRYGTSQEGVITLPV